MSVRIEHGDMLQVIPRLVAEGVVCDAVVTDPPYHLLPTQKRFGATKSAPAQHGRDGAMARLSSGFMGQQWDGGDIAFRPETWVAVATVLRPGSFLVAFGGTRTVHRLTCAIEDAGFVIQDCLMWLFATGFPKRRDMLKPAYEPIVLAYKPGGKRTMQIDECRIACADKAWGSGNRDSWRETEGREDRQRHRYGEPDKNPAGRWPANICHDGSDEVLACFPESAAKPVTETTTHSYDRGVRRFNAYGEAPPSASVTYYADSDNSAARFFFSAKAGANDRWGSRHPTVKPVELMKWLIALATPLGGLVLDPFAGSGTTCVAALATGRDCILIEREEPYIADIRERLAFYEGSGRHSVQAKNRKRKVSAGPLFDQPYDPVADATGSYNAAVRAIGERVKAGEPLPDFFRSTKPKAAE